MHITVLRRTAGPKSSLCRTGFHILPSLGIKSKPPSHTSTLQVSGRSPSNLGVRVRADPSTFEHERHRACPIVKTPTDQPSYLPLHRRYFQHAHFIPIVDVGKRGEYQLVHGDLPRQHPFRTTLRFTGPVPADSRQLMPSVRNCVSR